MIKIRTKRNEQHVTVFIGCHATNLQNTQLFLNWFHDNLLCYCDHQQQEKLAYMNEALSD